MRCSQIKGLGCGHPKRQVENAIAEMLHGLANNGKEGRWSVSHIVDLNLFKFTIVLQKANQILYQGPTKVVLIKEKLKVVRDHQKSYADNRRKPLEFEVGDKVLLKVSSWKGVMRFGKRGKLAPRYVGPFEILERIGPVAYRLRLPK
ncbi:hypothetical protein Tco_0625379 [Tanacetum coccineum]|uniref:Tf2-1-like SH3-like domain-containing protein n=1 Tax=Tanacetum coccineum TaxID=301880 RepID=A0ABQ4WGP7_9ASTR